MIGEEAITSLGATALLAGAAAAFSIAAFYYFIASSSEEAKFKKRMAAVKDHRSARPAGSPKSST